MPATAPRGKGHVRTNTVEIQESARLELVIPQASDLDISQAISKTLEDSSKPAATYAGGIPAVATIAQRDSLFYGSFGLCIFIEPVMKANSVLRYR